MAVGTHRVRHHQLHLRQLFCAVDAVFAEVVGVDVGHHRNIGTLHRQATPQDAATRGFQHSSLYLSVAQHGACTGWARPVTAGDGLAADKHTLGAAVTRAQTCGLGHRRQQAHGGGLAVAAGDQRGGHCGKR
jgi:hypothetical protein